MRRPKKRRFTTPRPAPACSYRGAHHTEARASDEATAKVREKVERGVTKLKPCRRMATRAENLSRPGLACLPLVSTWMLLRSFVTPA